MANRKPTNFPSDDLYSKKYSPAWIAITSSHLPQMVFCTNTFLRYTSEDYLCP
jgi:hypothetical protein